MVRHNFPALSIVFSLFPVPKISLLGFNWRIKAYLYIGVPSRKLKGQSSLYLSVETVYARLLEILFFHSFIIHDKFVSDLR
jgi:hypothetical protein